MGYGTEMALVTLADDFWKPRMGVVNLLALLLIILIALIPLTVVSFWKYFGVPVSIGHGGGEV